MGRRVLYTSTWHAIGMYVNIIYYILYCMHAVACMHIHILFACACVTLWMCMCCGDTGYLQHSALYIILYNITAVGMIKHSELIHNWV